jgi:hypothetical protein
MPVIFSEEQLQTISKIFLRANPNCTPPLSEIQEAAEWFQATRPFDEDKPDKTEKKKLEQTKKMIDSFAKRVSRLDVLEGIPDREAMIGCLNRWKGEIDSYLMTYPSMNKKGGPHEKNLTLKAFISRLVELHEAAGASVSCWYYEPEKRYKGSFFEIVLACLAPLGDHYSKEQNQVALGELIRDTLKKPLGWEAVQRICQMRALE